MSTVNSDIIVINGFSFNVKTCEVFGYHGDLIGFIKIEDGILLYKARYGQDSPEWLKLDGIYQDTYNNYLNKIIEQTLLGGTNAT